MSADTERILDEILADIDRRSKSESAVFSQQIFSDQPILQTGRQLKERQERLEKRTEARERSRKELQVKRQMALQKRQASRQILQPELTQVPRRTISSAQRTPKQYRRMEALEHSASHGSTGSLSYRSPTSGQLFFEQAQLMQDFEDDYESGYVGPMALYYPTYAAMTLDQQRSYFTWRTRLRQGETLDGPVAFAFIHAFELLCGAGTTPGEQGYRDLVDFMQTYGKTDAARGTTFLSRMRQWIRDYVIYHGLDIHFINDGSVTRGSAVAYLLDAEDTLLARSGRARKVDASSRTTTAVTDDELFSALCAASSYHLDTSRLTKDRPETIRSITCAVFAALVDHCSRRRKTDFVEGLFGQPSNLRYTMFAHAVFFDPRPHEDVIVYISRNEAFECLHGSWMRHLMCRREGPSKELGKILQGIDRCTREHLAYAHPLKARTELPRYLQKIVDEAIDAQLERERAEKARHIEIDFSRLDDIRSASALTQEALLVDEEREEFVSNASIPTTQMSNSDTERMQGFMASGTDALSERPLPYPAQVEELGGTSYGGELSDVERRVLTALLEGKDVLPLLGANDPMLSVVTDSINEKLFDMVGDAVIEFDNESPILVSEYVDDVRETFGRE